MTVENYIPKLIKQVLADAPKKVMTNVRWNELWNLNIEQGDYTAEELKNACLAILAGQAALTAHQTSADHDIRYYTETEVDAQNTAQDNALVAHKISGDHDSRYYTETEIDSKFTTRDTNITANTNALVTHKVSSDHDSRYYTEIEVDLQNAMQDFALTNHKASADHDGRYFTETELGAVTNGVSGADKIGATSIAGLAGNTVQTLLEALKVSINEAALGAVPDASLSDGKLVPDIKVGSLASLTTTEKTSVTAAINELVTSFATHTGNYVLQVPFAADTGVANTYAVSLTPAPTVYVDGMAIAIKIVNASTGASTLNVNALGAKPILDSLGNAITAGGLKAGLIYSLRYNATTGNFIVQGKGGGGNALAGNLLSGKTATTDAGQITGTMPTQGSQGLAWTNPGAGIAPQFVIPQGYWDGVAGGWISNGSLVPTNILSGCNIFGVVGTAIAGKRFATGTTPLGSSLSSFQYAGSLSVQSSYPLTVSGLTFKPSLILAKSITGTSGFILYDESGTATDYYAKTAKVGPFNDSGTSGAVSNYKGDYSPASVVSGGFTLPGYGPAGTQFGWLAVE